ncbi:hypothetical protein BJ508DRAFT_301986 [Ascobolus immersus RN42]|uniref:Uncharacterized protein n=1 Tax=Ascobolus immersus RN42 TaxID=1160509 RepID=A0A3N4ILQ8_ASCIM|nr:hypothetical protein BJ508DRAFT_301986 [Ascobolus immersus RN42]
MPFRACTSEVLKNAIMGMIANSFPFHLYWPFFFGFQKTNKEQIPFVLDHRTKISTTLQTTTTDFSIMAETSEPTSSGANTTLSSSKHPANLFTEETASSPQSPYTSSAASCTVTTLASSISTTSIISIISSSALTTTATIKRPGQPGSNETTTTPPASPIDVVRAHLRARGAAVALNQEKPRTEPVGLLRSRAIVMAALAARYGGEVGGMGMGVSGGEEVKEEEKPKKE